MPVLPGLEIYCPMLDYVRNDIDTDREIIKISLNTYGIFRNGLATVIFRSSHRGLNKKRVATFASKVLTRGYKYAVPFRINLKVNRSEAILTTLAFLMDLYYELASQFGTAKRHTVESIWCYSLSRSR